MAGGFAPLVAIAPDTAGARAAAAEAERALDALVSEALLRSPRLEALAEGVAAAHEGAPAEGALPDPMIAVAAVGEDYPGAAIGEDPMAMASVEVSQAVPWPGKRGRRQAAAEARVGVARADREAARRRLAAQVRSLFAEHAAAAAARRGLEESLALVDVLLPSARARYEAGLAGQLDLVGLQIERARLASDRDGLLGREAALRAELAAALDREEASLAPLGAAVPPVDDAAVAGVAAGDLAAVAAAEARRAAARRRAEAAEGEGSPDLVLGAEYGWRDALPPMITARVGVELPLWQGRKQDATARAARREEAMATAEVRDALAAAGAELAGLRARHEAAARQAARLRDEILPSARLAAEAARSGYVTGAVPGADLVDALRRLTEVRADLAEREADRYAAWATLRALAGRDPALSREDVR